MIKLKDILLEKAYKSGKLFVMKSPYSPKHMPYDHIGFITDDGEIIDMSGHRYTKDGKKPLPPKKYKYEDTEDLFKMPKNKEEAIEKGLYKEIPLPKGVEIPSETPTCSIDKSKAGNCGSFVKIVLSNNGIETTKSNDMTDIASAVANKTDAGKKSFKDPRKKAEPAKPKTKKKRKIGKWWNTASDTRKKAYIKKFGGPPNESIIKLKSLLPEGLNRKEMQSVIDRVYPQIAKDLGTAKKGTPKVEIHNNVLSFNSGIEDYPGDEHEDDHAQYAWGKNIIAIFKIAMKSEKDVIQALLHEYTHATQDEKKMKEYRKLGYKNNPYEKAATRAEGNWRKYV